MKKILLLLFAFCTNSIISAAEINHPDFKPEIERVKATSAKGDLTLGEHEGATIVMRRTHNGELVPFIRTKTGGIIVVGTQEYEEWLFGRKRYLKSKKKKK